MNSLYEIMIFTASTKDYADLIINVVDPNNEFIKQRFYRDHTSIMNMEVVKDLTKIKKDLSKVILVDNLSSNFKLQPYNGLHIKTWTDDIHDKQLVYLAKILRSFIDDKIEDVRKEIKKVHDAILIGKSSKLKKSSINVYSNLYGSNNEPDYKDIYLNLIKSNNDSNTNLD
jgi:TFIIF-interacting CTD phosphatase-like protein